MDYNLLSIIKKEKEVLIEDNNDNYLHLSFDVDIKVENNFDDYLQNVLSNNQQETLKYDNLNEEKIQYCSICSEYFLTSYSLYKHNLIHLKVPLVRQKLYICDVCSSFYKTKRHLKNHITKHKGKTLYNGKNSITKSLHKCEVCKKVLNYRTWFDHIKDVHAQTKVQCDKCEKWFKCKRTLRNHMLHLHEGMRPPWRSIKGEGTDSVPCPKCPKMLLNKYSLTTHLRNCHSGRTFKCKICKSVLKSKPYLRTHIQRVHYNDGKLHHCEICGKSFKSPRYLKVHKKNSHTYLE